MKRFMAAVAGGLIPGVALADGGGVSGFSFWTCLLQMFCSLAVVVGAVYLLAYIARQSLAGFGGKQGVRSYIRVVESRCLAPKKSLILVEVAGEYLLLSNSADGISLIKQIDMVEEAELIDAAQRSPLSGTGFQTRLEGMMAKMTIPRLLSPAPRSEG
jgi:flagellar protein FliO/FliZ